MKKCILYPLACFLIVVLCICGSFIDYEKTQIDHRVNLESVRIRIKTALNNEDDLECLLNELDSLNKIATTPYFKSLYFYILGVIYEVKEIENNPYLAPYLKSLEALESKFIDNRSFKLHISGIYRSSLFFIYNNKFEIANRLIDYGINVIDTTDLNFEKWKMHHVKAKLIYKEQNPNRLSEALCEIELASQYGKKYNYVQYLMSQNLKGLLEISNNDWDKAIHTYNKILNSDSTPIKQKILAYHNLGYIEELNFRYEKAIAFLKQSENLQNASTPPDILNLTNLALCQLYYKNLNYDSAVIYGQKSSIQYSKVRQIPRYYNVFQLLSNAYYKLGNFEQSQYFINAYIQENEKWIYRTETEYYQLNIEEQIAGFLAKPIIPNRKDGLSIDVIISWISTIFLALYIGGMIQQFLLKKKAKEALREII